MINVVEKSRQVDIYSVTVLRFDMTLHGFYSLMCRAIETKTVAMLRQGWGNDRLQALYNSLLYQSVVNRRNSQ